MAFDVTIVAHDRASRVLDRVGRAATELSAKLATVGKAGAAAGGLAVVGAAAAATAGHVFALAAAIAPAANAIGLLPAVALAAGAAIGTLKLATAGFADALKEAWKGNLDKFNEAIKNWAPAAQQAARAIVALKPAIDNLKRAVQQQFFNNLGKDIGVVAFHYLPVLKTQLERVAAAWNVAARGALNMVMSSKFLDSMNITLINTGSALTNLAKVVKPLVSVFGDLAAVGSGFFVGLTAGAERAAQGLAAMVAQARATGRLEAILSNALSTLGQLGQVAGNVGGILGGMFRAAEGSGAGVLENLKSITGAARDLVNSLQGQTALGAVFAALGEMSRAVAPVVKALVVEVGKLAPAIGSLATVAAPGLEAIVKGAGELLRAAAPGLQVFVGALANVFKKLQETGTFDRLGTAIGKVFEALAPLLPKLGELVVKLAEILTRESVLQLITNLGRVLVVTADALVWIVDKVDKFVLGFQRLAQAFTSTDFSKGLFTILLNLPRAFAEVNSKIGAFFTETIPGWWQAVTRATAAAWSGIVNFFKTVGSWIANFFTATIPAAINTVVAWLTALPARVGAALAALPGLLWQAFVESLNRVAYAVGFTLGRVTAFFVNLPGQIHAAVTALWDGVVARTKLAVETTVAWALWLRDRAIAAVIGLASGVTHWISDTWNRAVNRTATGTNAVSAWVQALPGRIWAWLSGLPGMVAGLFSSMWNWAANVVAGGVNHVIAWVRTLPGNLYNAGVDAINGLLRGINSMIGHLWGLARNVASNFVRGFKEGLGISSPSKVMMDVAVNGVGAGLFKGLDSLKGQVTARAQVLADATVNGYRVAALPAPAPALLGPASGGAPGGDIVLHATFTLPVTGEVIQKAVLRFARTTGKRTIADVFPVGG